MILCVFFKHLWLYLSLLPPLSSVLTILPTAELSALAVVKNGAMTVAQRDAQLHNKWPAHIFY